MALQLLGVRNALRATPEQVKKHCGRLTASHLQLESIPSSLASSFVKGVCRMVSDTVAAHRARLTDCSCISAGRLGIGLVVHGGAIACGGVRGSSAYRYNL